MRECVLNADDNNLVKKWLKKISHKEPLGSLDQKRYDFLGEILRSQFNLITDQKIKNQIIEIIPELPNETVPERILTSYLYLMIGNVSRSDNIIKEIINTPPKDLWRGNISRQSMSHQLLVENLKKALEKMGRHPTDRTVFRLLLSYLKHFYNEKSLIEAVDGIDNGEIERKLGLKYVERKSPSLVHHIRLENMQLTRRMNQLRKTDLYPWSEQSAWVWAFMEIDPLISVDMVQELKRTEEKDELWLIYLLGNEKLADLYMKKEKRSFLPGRRAFLRKQLSHEKDFMMALYKLIELGDIDSSLIKATSDFMTND